MQFFIRWGSWFYLLAYCNFLDHAHILHLLHQFYLTFTSLFLFLYSHLRHLEPIFLQRHFFFGWEGRGIFHRLPLPFWRIRDHSTDYPFISWRLLPFMVRDHSTYHHKFKLWKEPGWKWLFQSYIIVLLLLSSSNLTCSLIMT